MHMSGQTKQRITSYLRTHRRESLLAVRIAGILLLVGAFAVGLLGGQVGSVSAQSACASGRGYTVSNGDMLGGIAARHNTTWQKLASFNHLANPNVLSVNQLICIPRGSAVSNTV